MNYYMQSPVQSAGQPYGPAQPVQQPNTGQMYGPAQQTQYAYQTPGAQQQRAAQQTQPPFYTQAQNRMPNGGPQNQTANNSGILGKLFNPQDPIGSLSKIVSIMKLFK